MKHSRFFIFLSVSALFLAACNHARSGEVAYQDGAEGEGAVIEMTDAGFNPSNTYIKSGDVVTFHNTGSVVRWPASNEHPVHGTCPGFDPLTSIKSGGKWSYKFTKVQECPFHDHLSPGIGGKIVVEPAEAAEPAEPASGAAY